MLVVSRKIGQSICIADNIHVTVSDVRSGRVRISIDAPRSVRVMRQERVSTDSLIRSPPNDVADSAS